MFHRAFGTVREIVIVGSFASFYHQILPTSGGFPPLSSSALTHRPLGEGCLLIAALSADFRDIELGDLFDIVNFYCKLQ